MFAVINLHTTTVKALLEHGADVNARAEDGSTALMLAAVCGDKDIAQSLLNKGATADGWFARTGLTAVRVAEMRGFTEIVPLLKKTNLRNR